MASHVAASQVLSCFHPFLVAIPVLLDLVSSCSVVSCPVASGLVKSRHVSPSDLAVPVKSGRVTSCPVKSGCVTSGSVMSCHVFTL
jgi:hypothetical protein